MKIKTSLRYETEHATLRGVGSVVDFWPIRVVVIGNESSDKRQLASDWRKVGNDFRKVIQQATNERG